MSEEEKKTIVDSVNRTPLQSKKFIAAMMWNLVWLLLIGLAIIKDVDGAVIQSMVWACATSCGLYLGGQSFVDSIVRYGAMKFPSLVNKDEE